jgi:hypothetical protein
VTGDVPPLTGRPVRQQNGGVRRLLLLAFGLSLLLWTTASPADAVLRQDVASMSGGACALVPDAGDTGGTDQQWRARHQTIAVTAWKVVPVHAGLATALVLGPGDWSRRVSAPDPPVRPAPRYLRHTPLLI